MRLVTPSKPDLWRGTPSSRTKWTVEQEKYLHDHGAGWNGENFTVTVTVSKLDRDMMIERKVKAQVLCPLLRTTKTGRLVVTSCGLPKWIDRTGDNV